MMNIRTQSALALLFCSAMACASDGGDGDGDGDGGGDDMAGTTSGGDDGETGAVGACSDANEPEPFYAPPGDCYNNKGCESCYCVTFRDNPPFPEAACGDPTHEGIHVTATLLTFPDGAPVPNVALRIVEAAQIGLLGPENAPSLAEVNSDSMGRIDITIAEPMDQFGVVALVEADGFRATATGLAKPEAGGRYEKANAIHDLFVIPEALLQGYSDELAGEPELTEFLPLGEQGGVVGIARSRYTGEAVAGVVIRSLDDPSNAVARYLNEDGTFNADATTSTGIYVVINPALAEDFEAVLDGEVRSTRANRAGSGPPGIFTMNLTINVDPGADPFPGD